MYQTMPRDSPPPVLGSIGAEIRRAPKLKLHRQSLPEIGTKTCSLFSKITEPKPQPDTSKLHVINHNNLDFSFGKDKTANSSKYVMSKEGEKVRPSRGLTGHALYGNEFKSKSYDVLPRASLVRYKTML